MMLGDRHLSSAIVLGLMTPEESARVKELIEQIKVEKDQNKFIALVRELNDLLDRKEKRLEPKERPE
jgi:hypothetical protein